jgi:hypothetical protein
VRQPAASVPAASTQPQARHDRFQGLRCGSSPRPCAPPTRPAAAPFGQQSVPHQPHSACRAFADCTQRQHRPIPHGAYSGDLCTLLCRQWQLEQLLNNTLKSLLLTCSHRPVATAGVSCSQCRSRKGPWQTVSTSSFSAFDWACRASCHQLSGAATAPATATPRHSAYVESAVERDQYDHQPDPCHGLYCKHRWKRGTTASVTAWRARWNWDSSKPYGPPWSYVCQTHRPASTATSKCTSVAPCGS